MAVGGPVSDVIIIGAGLAGATAALELSKRNLNVTILEARDRIGRASCRERVCWIV